ncbi:hypothetical protein BH18ACT1_BH18ACT1_13290 [soil metagenome]
MGFVPGLGHHLPKMRRIVIVLGVVVAVGLLVWASSRDADDAGDQAQLTDSAVEELIPADGAQDLRQREIGIDLAPSWTAVLVVDGEEIPEDQLRRNEPLNQVFFRPGEGQVIDELFPGPHGVSALIWRPQYEDREDARTVSWSFRVS